MCQKTVENRFKKSLRDRKHVRGRACFDGLLMVVFYLMVELLE